MVFLSHVLSSVFCIGRIIIYQPTHISCMLCSLFICASLHSRERNRMHAKMTRDRKRNFISTIEKTIADLESDNKRMRHTLEKQVSKSNTGTPNPSPSISAVPRDVALVSTDLTLTAAVSVSVPVSAPFSAPTPEPEKESVAVSPEPGSAPLAKKQYISLERLTATLSAPLPPRKVSETSPRHGFQVIA